MALPESLIRTATPNPGSDVVVAFPFVVTTEKDVGFVAATSLAGGRLTTALKDTPVAYSVITHAFIDALNLMDTESAVSWSVGSYAPPTSTLNYKFFNFEGGSSVMARGIQTNAPQRNFFLLGLNSDVYSQERIDIARGPNAPLIGTSGLGGVVNSLTKQAITDRSFISLTQTLGSWNRYRSTIDLNGQVGGRAAVRINTLWQNADSWRDQGFDNRRGLHLALTVKPFSTTKVRAEYEYYKQDLRLGLDSVNDRVSGWDGTSVAAAPTSVIANSDAKGIARNGSSSTPYLVYIPGDNPSRVMNWANTWTTMGGAANPSVPVGGVLPLSPSNLGIDGGSIIGSTYDPHLLFDLATQSADFRVPGRKTVISPNAPMIRYDFQNAGVFIEHHQGTHLFLEAALNVTRTHHLSEYIETSGLADARIDVNQTLPDGQPNPNFKQPYGESVNGHTHFDDQIEEARAAMAVVFNDTVMGDFRGDVIVGGREDKSYTYQLTEVLDRNADPRRRPFQDTFYYRYYWNDPSKPFTLPRSVTYVDPVASSSTTYDVTDVIDLSRPGNQRFSNTRFGYIQTALNAHLFRGRLNLTAGFRRDDFRVDSLTLNGNANAVANDYPLGWDGQTIYYRPDAPADYWQLSYVPKDSAGIATGPVKPAAVRPRINGVPLPQYANERFQDDYSSPPVKFSVNTVSYGGVLHALPWLSVYSNYAESFNPPVSGLTMTGASVPPGLSDGWDLGIRFSLLNGRISASFGKYGSTQRNNSFDSTGSTRKYADIAAANAVGDFTPNGMNQRGLALLPSPTFDFRDRKANGYEIDVVANLTTGWRLIANAAWPKVYTTNNARDEWVYLRINEATLRQVVLDAGGVIDAGNGASVDTSIPVGNRSPDVSAAVAAWNNIQTFKATNDPAAVTPSNLPNYTANFYTDYAFGRGTLLRGFRLGAGVQYIGKRIIGNRGADTIVDPADSSRAIDDPTVSSITPVYRGSYHLITGTIAYHYKLKHDRALKFNLTITNLLNEDRLIYIGTGLRPPGGDITRPDRVTVPISFTYLQPRAFTFTAAFEF